MAPSGDLLHLVHDVSSISVDFRGPTAASQELRSRSLESCKTSIRSLMLIPTSMNQGDSAKHPHKKYKENSIELRSVRRRLSSRYNHYMQMKCRKEVRNYRNQTCVLNCNQSQCPALRERLEHHRCTNYRHRIRGNIAKKYREQGINASQSGLSLLQTAQLPVDGKSVQTEITLEDFILQHESVTYTLNYLKDLSLKGSETREVLPKRNFYKEHLRDEILIWLKNVPIFYSLDFTVQYLKDNFVPIFVDRIAQAVLIVNQDNYELNVKKEIGDCLNMLPMWLPNSPKDQVLFKNSLKDKLYSKIEKVNAIFYNTNVKTDDENEDNSKHASTESEEISLVRSNSLYAKVVTSWLGKIKFKKPISKRQIVDNIVKRISSLLNVPLPTTICKTKLKSEILNVLEDLPIIMFSTTNKNVHLNRFSDELANKLLNARVKLESPEKHIAEKFATQITGIPMYNNQLKQIIHETVSKAIGKTNLDKKSDIEREVRDVILNCLETLRSGIKNNISKEIYDVLCRRCNITEERAMKVAKKIQLYIKIALKHDKASKRASFHSIKPQLSGAMTIYRSSESGPITSTPKKPIKKNVPRLNSEERAYIINVADLIRTWMEMLPKKFDDDKQYKETIINDLAGDIMDEVKREQLSPDVDTEKDQHINYFVYRWLSRFEIYDDLNDAKPLVEIFLVKLKQIPELQLTTPQQGTRQAMHNLNHLEKHHGTEEFVPRGLDILEDQISVWMNEQPSEIYITDGRKNRNQMIKELATKIQDHLRNKDTENKITEDINEWLIKVINPKEIEHLGLLTQYLKDAILHVPQDETLEARNQKRKQQRAENREQKTSTASPESDDAYSIQEDPEETMKEFILKYVEHNYNIDDPMAKGAFCHLLKTELRKLGLSTRQELYDNFANNEQFTPEKFENELEYISMISDWLKNIPISPLYNTPGNRARVDFVNDLARNIQEAEDQRKEYVNDMDYDLFLSSVISISLRTYNIPILPEHKNNIPLMINQLLSKIIAKRSLINQPHSVPGGVSEQSLSEMIDQYIKINTREATDDDIKQEAWTARLLKEVNKIRHEESDSIKFSKAEVYERLSQVPIPGKESVRRFSLEMKYIKEITDWLKNLPLLPIADVGDKEKERIKMISELAEKISEREMQKSSDPNDNTADKTLVEYITNWISKLNLDRRKTIIIPILIQQLMNRVEKINRKELTIPDSSQFEDMTIQETSISIEDALKNPGTHIVELIEKWCNILPIEGNDQEMVRKMKQEIATKLYQKISELNVNPRIYNDDTLYKTLLEDAVDTLLENIPQNSELQNNRNTMRAELLHNILAMKKVITQNFAGDSYKHKLETTIDAAIPNPIQNRQIIDPGFEIYKKHLTNMFILENFDHSDDDIKTKYEKRIRDEVDKYFESAQIRNALPMTRAQMYNELYSELFKVPMPCEDSVVDQVEEVKTLCEIDAWFDDLPLREASNISEYLERYQILSTLAKRIHDIEKYESNPEEKIHNEIRKWLKKLPLLTRRESKTNNYIDELQSTLKTSAEARKYVAAKPREVNKTLKKQSTKSPNISQVAGPCIEKKKCVCVATSYKRPGDLIVEVVESWCDQLDLVGDEIENKILKDNLATKIVMKICELNMDRRLLNDDILYDRILEEELKKYISDFPATSDFEQCKLYKSRQLIEMIGLIKPLIKQGHKKHEYKKELNDTIISILKSHNETSEKSLEFDKIKEEIIDNFLQLNYYEDDDETRQTYKRNLHDAVSKLLTDIKDKEKHLNPLIRTNQLLCELSKIPIPNNSLLKDEIDEIKMKQEVEELFEDNFLNDNTVKTDQMKKVLAKKLNEIEKSGHNNFNDDKMGSEIARCLAKLSKEISPTVIKEFVNSLKNNEADRKRPSINKRLTNEKSPTANKFPFGHGYERPTDFGINNTRAPVFYPESSRNQTEEPHRHSGPGQFNQVPTILDQSHCRSDQQWTSLGSATPRKRGPLSYAPFNISPSAPYPESFRHGRQSEMMPPYRFDAGNDLSSAPNHQGFQSCSSEAQQNYSIPFQDGNIKPLSDRTPHNSCGYTSQYPNQNPSQIPPKYYEASSNQQCFSTNSEGQNLDPPLLSYSDFRARNNGVSDQYCTPGNISQISLKGGPSNAFVAPYEPSISADQQSLSEIVNSRKVATPRKVQVEANEYEPSAPYDVRPDSMFQAPRNIIPGQFTSRLTVLSRNPSGSSRCLRPSRIPSGRSSRNYPTIGSKRTSGTVEPSEEMCTCICDKRNKRWKCGPFCMVPAEEYCEECGGYTPTWCKLPLRGCFYMQCV